MISRFKNMNKYPAGFEWLERSGGKYTAISALCQVFVREILIFLLDAYS
jgi:hypothetical protein